ncbi:MAG: hypothetical protein IJ617_05030 [Oscillospiraceae bacterium]|nr:hypothetical protein [Oscillospiraceae bacterium]
MALFFREDRSYDVSRRLTGFDRYRQLMGFYALRWMVVNLITVGGALPLAAGIWLSIASSSILVLVPASLTGGVIFGPFLAGMYDSIMRGLRDAPGKWIEHWKKSWRQNWRGSLLPGGILGFLTGMFAFMLYIIWSAQAPAGWGTLLIYLISAALLIWVNTLYWPQLVLFEQSNAIRLKNAVLFTIRHFRRVAGVVVMQLAYIIVLVMFAPWTLILIPFLGFWFILLVSQLRLYDDLNEALQIEARFIPLEGDPWRVSPLDEQSTEEP